MTPKLIQKIIGGSSVLLGLLWIGGIVLPFARETHSADLGGTNIAFLLILVPVMGIPGVLAIVFGVQLLKEMKGLFLIRVLAIGAFFGALSLSAGISDLEPKILPERVLDTVVFFSSILIMIPIYMFTVRVLIKKITGRTIPKALLFSRGFLILMALQFFNLLSTFFREYLPKKEAYANIPEAPWGTIGFIISIIIPYVIYRSCMDKLTKAQQHAVGNPFAA